MDEKIFFRVIVPVEKCIQPEVPSSPRLLFRIFITVIFLTLTISQPTQDFSRTSGNRMRGWKFDTTIWRKCALSYRKIYNVSDWPVRKRIKPTDGKNATYISKSPIKCRL